MPLPYATMRFGQRGSLVSPAGRIGPHVVRAIRSLHKPILLPQQHYTEPQSIMLAYHGSATTLKILKILAANPLGKDLPVHPVIGPTATVAPSLFL